MYVTRDTWRLLTNVASPPRGLETHAKFPRHLPQLPSFLGASLKIQTPARAVPATVTVIRVRPPAPGHTIVPVTMPVTAIAASAHQNIRALQAESTPPGPAPIS